VGSSLTGGSSFEPLHAPEPLISRHADGCTSSWGCVRHCPAHAIRVVGGQAEIVAERCVSCGVCVTDCANGGYRVRSDLPKVRALLQSGRPIVAVMASEHVAALHPRTTGDVERALEAIGFDAVETTVLGEELVAAAYEQVHSREHDALPRLRSTCPVVVGWVQRFYPELVSTLVSVIPPYIAQARIVKQIYPPGTIVVYVSPCWARKDEIREPQFEGAVDVAIGFDELKQLLSVAPLIEDAEARLGAEVRRPRFAKEISLTDGFPRSTLVERDMTDGNIVAVRGLADLDRLLTGIMRGEIAPSVVDMLNCEGCVDGPAVNAELSVFAKRNLISADRERQPPPPVDTRTFLSSLPPIELRRSFVAMPAISRVPADGEIDEVLAAGEFASRGDVLDCGACGYDTCVEHAAAICLGDSSWELCLPLQRKRMERERDVLHATALLDELTGLGNRRAFDTTLRAECARADRHGGELSLLMIDLDRFKGINDRFGHPAGDMVLCGFAEVLKSALRVSDFPARYGGDEFAVILPETGKTDTWIVAEKIRAALAKVSFEVGDEGTAATASVGVASFGGANRTSATLLAAADAALYRAKHRGRDRVELAGG